MQRGLSRGTKIVIHRIWRQIKLKPRRWYIDLLIYTTQYVIFTPRVSVAVTNSFLCVDSKSVLGFVLALKAPELHTARLNVYLGHLDQLTLVYLVSK